MCGVKFTTLELKQLNPKAETESWLKDRLLQLSHPTLSLITSCQASHMDRELQEALQGRQTSCGWNAGLGLGLGLA